MKNRLCLLILIILLPMTMTAAGLHSSGSAGSGGQRTVRKQLPLDVLPNAVHKTREGSRWLPGKVIVKIERSAAWSKTAHAFGVPSLDAFAARYGATSIEPLFPGSEPQAKAGAPDLSVFYVMNFSAPVDPFSVAGELSQRTEVRYAEPWFVYPVTGVAACTPNDTARHSQWYLTKMMADTAFCLSAGDTSVVIGIVDTGIETGHPDLAGNIWHNPGEMGLDSHGNDKRTNGIDDDGDGFIDDWQGWDFGGASYAAPVADNDPTPNTPQNGHGTEVAGLASAVTNNTTGIVGMGNRCRLMAVKTTSDDDTRGGGFPLVVFGYEGIAFAADHGAKIINCSWGGSEASQFEQDVINYATSRGSLVVAAAGNDYSGAPNYPAGYANVFSVAGTTLADLKSSFSNYGPTIDACAPAGEAFNNVNIAIYSTDYPSTYGIGAGTSFSSPLVAGVAGLVAARFPALTPIQIGEQVRVTSDYIDNLNSFYAHQLGKGRVNAFRALNESSPSLRMVSFTASDSATGNNNGALEPNELFTIAVTVENYLQPTSAGAVLTLSSTDGSVQVVSGSWPVGALGTFATAGNAAAPFTVRVAPNAASSHNTTFLLSMSDGAYQDFQLFTVTVNPTYVTPSLNGVHVTLTNNGRIGFNDFPDNTQGVGFTFGGVNQLFEGGLILGTSATKLVDNVRNDSGVQDADFTSSQLFTLATPGSIADQDGSTSFTDSGAAAANQLGVGVNLYSFAYASPADSNYIILRYDIRNRSGAPLTNLYAGLFLDWDVSPDFNTNLTGFDPSRDLGLAYDPAVPNQIICGVRALDGAIGFRGLLNTLSIDLTRSGKWGWLSGGYLLNDTVGDVHFAISSGPYTIPPGGKQTVGFALVAGSSFESIDASADLSAGKWATLKHAVGRPKLIAPVNGSTVAADTTQVRWGTAIGADWFKLEVATDTGFAHVVFRDSVATLSDFVPLPEIDTTYYWHVMAGSGAYTGPWSVRSVFSTNSIYHVKIPVLQNPVLSRYADIVVTTDFPLLNPPVMTVTVAADPPDTVSLALLAPQTYKGSYEFHAAGTASVEVQTTRQVDSGASTTQRLFAIGLFKEGETGTVAAPGNLASVRFPAVREETWVTAMSEDAASLPDGAVGSAYTFGPSRTFPSPVAVSLRYPPDAASPGRERYLHLMRASGNGWVPVPSRVSAASGTVSADVASLGTFVVVYDERYSSGMIPAAYALGQNYPNPFNPSTRISYALPEPGRVKLTVYNIMGQEITRLVDDEREAGEYTVVWNGTNARGGEAASGIYFYRVDASGAQGARFSDVRKMLLVR